MTLILLTNDDGIGSPGLRAAAEALAGLGELIIAAPREQQTSAGRAFPSISEGTIQAVEYPLNGSPVQAYAVAGSPAQTVLHALLEIVPHPPDLVVAGINYGENVGSSVTISGTVGAALEAAGAGIPALAVSLQILNGDFYTYHDLDFAAAAHFTRVFARRMLEARLPFDVDVLKVEVPADATPATPWQMTRLSRRPYYRAVVVRPGGWDTRPRVEVYPDTPPEEAEPGSDVEALIAKRVVAVTPLSLDLTSRVELEVLGRLLSARGG